MKNLCAEAAMCPIRENIKQIRNIKRDEIRPINVDDFIKALETTKKSVSQNDIG
jgi:fidgetin-like protein 1